MRSIKEDEVISGAFLTGVLENTSRRLLTVLINIQSVNLNILSGYRSVLKILSNI